MFAGRSDRFSQLLSALLKNEHKGSYLLAKRNLSEQDWAELKSLAPEAHAGFRVELQDATERLRALLALGDPLYIATIIQLRNLFVSWGEYYEPTHDGLESKVELVGGLLATQPTSQKLDAPTDAEMQQIFDEIDHVLGVLLLFNLSKLPIDNQVAATLRFTGAMHWMLLRGSSYGNHGRDLARTLYAPHSEWMLATHGFTVDDVLELGDTVESFINGRVNELMKQAEEFSNAIVRHLQAEAGGERITDETRKLLSTKEGRFQVGGRGIIDVVQTGIRHAMTFSVDDLFAFNPALRPERATAALDELSIAVGSLDRNVYTGLFDKSPLIERPFLEFNGRYLLVVPGMVLRDTVALLEGRLMTGRMSFSVARARALDSLAVKYLSEMLPGSVTYTNLHYEATELDGLVLFEDIAFVVEGKGTALSVQGHRGDVARLQRDIRRAVEDAWRQGARAREFILSDRDCVFLDETGAAVRVLAGSVHDVIIVNPTLHELGGHGPQLGRLRALGLFPDDELPWSVYINDLRVIAETCDNAAIFLHYLVWRSRLPLGERIVASDEIDLWGCYLNSERFGMLAESGKAIVANSSTDFDAYYDGLLGHGPKRKAPTKFLREPVRAFVKRMASERPRGWRQAAGACLDLSIPELALVCAKAKGVAALASREGQPAWLEVGRVMLVGIPRKGDLTHVFDESEPYDGDATLVFYCREATPNRAAIVWARYAKPVTFELSEFEKAAFARTSSFDFGRESWSSQCPRSGA